MEKKLEDADAEASLTADATPPEGGSEPIACPPEEEAGLPPAPKGDRDAAGADPELLGVSVWFLAVTFLAQLKKHGTLYGHGCATKGSFCGKGSPEQCPHRLEFTEKNMDEIRPYDFDAPELREKGKGMACPRDGEPGCAYVDYVASFGKGFVGLANVMLSYTWGYSIGAIATALWAFCERTGRNPKSTYVWICCMCINQHRVAGTTVSTEFLKNEFETRVKGIGYVVSLLSPFARPVNLTRSWYARPTRG